jgi:hypothetical protein
VPCHEQHCHTESPDVRGVGSLIPAPKAFRCYIARRTTVDVFSGRGSKAKVAQNSAAAVGAKDDVVGFNIVMKDAVSMDVGDGVADIGPDAKIPAFGYGGYEAVINKFIDTDSRDVFESEDQTESVKSEELNNIALGINLALTGCRREMGGSH